MEDNAHKVFVKNAVRKGAMAQSASETARIVSLFFGVVGRHPRKSYKGISSRNVRIRYPGARQGAVSGRGPRHRFRAGFLHRVPYFVGSRAYGSLNID